MSTHPPRINNGIGTTRETYRIEKSDLYSLEDEGLNVDIPLQPVKSIKVIYTENGDEYASLSVTAENYVGPETELATHQGEDLKWSKVRRKLRDLSE